MAGLSAAGCELGLELDEQLIAPTEWNGSGPMQLFDWLFSHDPVPTAVFFPYFCIAQSLHPMMKRGEMTDISDAVLYLDTAGVVSGARLHGAGGARAGR